MECLSLLNRIFYLFTLQPALDIFIYLFLFFTVFSFVNIHVHCKYDVLAIAGYAPLSRERVPFSSLTTSMDHLPHLPRPLVPVRLGTDQLPLHTHSGHRYIALKL
jgi:hypothetical protein